MGNLKTFSISLFFWNSAKKALEKIINCVENGKKFDSAPDRYGKYQLELWQII